MNGGLLPGCIFMLEYSRYNYWIYPSQPYIRGYYFKKYSLQYDIILN